jgi:hypothetical protein
MQGYDHWKTTEPDEGPCEHNKWRVLHEGPSLVVSECERCGEIAHDVSRPIVTHFVCPPIPDRRFDWQATFDDYEGGDPIGFGRTEDEAIEDLVAEVEFRAEAA